MRARLMQVLLILVVLIPIESSYAQEIRCESEISKMKMQDRGYKPLKTVSIFALLADPEKYHGQRIGVVGVFRLYFDRMSLYATKEHLAADEFSSMVWADLPKCIGTEDLDEMSEWQGEFVRVDGVFNAKLKEFSSGTLQHIELVKPWERQIGSDKM